jgi:hypothetical protein
MVATKEDGMEPIEVVELTAKEKQLSDGALFWDMDNLERADDTVKFQQLENMGLLAESLLEREVIPQHRLDYFFDSTVSVGKYGKSLEKVYEGNGTSGHDIYRHPHFMEHLRYFINGPDLPPSVIQGFCKIIEDDLGTSAMVQDNICKFVRKSIREAGLDHNAPDEFFKLAHEIGKGLIAEDLRKAAMSVKKK